MAVSPSERHPSERHPATSLAERFWSIARCAPPSASAPGDAAQEARAVVQHVLAILDALAAGAVGEGITQSTLSFLHLLRQSEAAGDWSYASPEQARGSAVDERSLVFSVGVLIFEELTGRHPFGADASPRRLARIQKCELGSGVQYFPQVPAELRSVLMKAMGPFPEERYSSLAKLRGELERYLSGRKAPLKSRKRTPLRGLPPSPADLFFADAEESQDAQPTQVRARVPPMAPATEERPRPARQPRPAARPALRSGWRGVGERLGWVLLGAAVALAAAWLAPPAVRSKILSALLPVPTAQAPATPSFAQPVVTSLPPLGSCSPTTP